MFLPHASPFGFINIKGHSPLSLTHTLTYWGSPMSLQENRKSPCITSVHNNTTGTIFFLSRNYAKQTLLDLKIIIIITLTIITIIIMNRWWNTSSKTNRERSRRKKGGFFHIFLVSVKNRNSPVTFTLRFFFWVFTLMYIWFLLIICSFNVFYQQLYKRK